MPVKTPTTKLDQFKEKYPAYQNWSDEALASRLYSKFYAQHMSREEFDDRVGLKDKRIAETGALSRGFSGGLRSLAAMGGGAISAIGDVFGSEDVQTFGSELYKEYSREAARYMGYTPTLEEVFQSEDKFDDFSNWLLTNVGQGAATTIPAALAFLVNPTLGAGVVYGMGVGETYGAQLEEGDDPVAAYAFAAGIPYAMAERVFGAGARVAGMIRGGAGPTASKSFLKRLSAEVPKTMAGEATAEFLQEGITAGAAGLEQGRTLAEIYTPEQFKHMGEAAAAGAVGGGPFGIVAAVPGPRQPPQPAPGAPPPTEAAPAEPGLPVPTQPGMPPTQMPVQPEGTVPPGAPPPASPPFTYPGDQFPPTIPVQPEGTVPPGGEPPVPPGPGPAFTPEPAPAPGPEPGPPATPPTEPVPEPGPAPAPPAQPEPKPEPPAQPPSGGTTIGGELGGMSPEDVDNLIDDVVDEMGGPEEKREAWSYTQDEARRLTAEVAGPLFWKPAADRIRQLAGTSSLQGIADWYAERYGIPKLKIEKVKKPIKGTGITHGIATGMKDADGRIRPTGLQIADTMDEDEAIITLRHEIEHLLDYMAGYNATVEYPERWTTDASGKKRLEFVPGHHQYYTAFNSDYTHKFAVRDALEAGLPVPENVLADYPELVEEMQRPEAERKFRRELHERGKATAATGDVYRLRQWDEGGWYVARSGRGQRTPLAPPSKTTKWTRRQAIDAAVEDVGELVPKEFVANEEELHRLSGIVADHFAQEKGFTGIVEARAFINERAGAQVDQKVAEEIIELGIVKYARGVVERASSPDEAYDALVDFYQNRQPTLTTRTGDSVRRQAYSTPAPIALVASRLADVARGRRILDPAAGTGMLLIEADPNKTHANEIDELRQKALRVQGFEVTAQDAAEKSVLTLRGMPSLDRLPDRIIMNPPFSTVFEDDKTKTFRDVPGIGATQKIDHAIALRQLEMLRLSPASGHAVLILQGQSGRDATKNHYGGIKNAGFYKFLYDEFNVVDHFTLSGDLYKKQGAGYPVDIIVIQGRGRSSLAYPGGVAPPLVKSFEELRDAIDGKRFNTSTRPSEGSGLGDQGPGPAGPGGAPVGGPRGPGGGPTGVAGLPGPPAGSPGGYDRPGGRGSGEGDVSGVPSPGPAGGTAGTPGPAEGPVGGDVRGPQPEPAPSPPKGGVPGGPAPRDQEGGPPDQEGKPGGMAGPAGGDRDDLTKPPPGGKPDVDQGIDDFLDDFGDVFKKAGEDFEDARDEDIYQQVLPGLIRNLEAALAENIGLADFSRRVVGAAKKKGYDRQQLMRLGVALKRFIKDVQAGRIIIRGLNDEVAEDTDEELADKIAEEARKRRAGKEEGETEFQVPYIPGSGQPSVETQIPKPMMAAVDRSLSFIVSRLRQGSRYAQIEDSREVIDTFVADKLQIPLQEIRDKGYLSAEQVDALAMSIWNIEGGGSFILGDQTGVGKGRVVAGLIKYAKTKGIQPVFITESPALYADMYRDLNNIGWLDFKALPTNRDLTGKDAVPLPGRAALNEEDETRVLKTPRADLNRLFTQIIRTGKLPEGYDALFTTYSQMSQHNRENTERHPVFQALAPNAFFILDESHEAGGTENAVAYQDEEGNVIVPRSVFIRMLLDRARHAAFSSGTFAKNPHTMTLYSPTTISLVENNPERLAATMRAGGVPLQEAIAEMLGEDGQYTRREKSFKGISVPAVKIETDVEVAERNARTSRDIYLLDSDPRMTIAKRNFAAWVAATYGVVTSSGQRSKASTTEFASIMHNIIAQSLLAMKVDIAADQAIEAWKRGEKPIITLANTMETLITEYTDDKKIKKGQRLSDLRFNDYYLRYLNKIRTITLTNPFRKRDKQYFTMTDEQLEQFGSPQLLQDFKAVEQMIDEADLGSLPASPIDRLIYRLEEAGMKVGELTGRNSTINQQTGILETRDPSPAQKKRTMNAFNKGALDALVMNRSAATGFSMHAAPEYKDHKPRHMVITQPELDINKFVQLLGRINRTGQVELPIYSVLTANLPMETRPAAVLAKKMAMLNANVTAGRKTAISPEGSLDFFNEVGVQVLREYLADHPALSAILGVKPDEADADKLISRTTGRLSVLSVKENIPVTFAGAADELPSQERFYEELTDRFTERLEQLKALGENPLEATHMDLQATLLTRGTLTPEKGGDSVFARSAFLDKMEVNRLVKPLTPRQLVRRVLIGLGEKPADVHVVTDELNELVRLMTRADARPPARPTEELGRPAEPTEPEPGKEELPEAQPGGEPAAPARKAGIAPPAGRPLRAAQPEPGQQSILERTRELKREIIEKVSQLDQDYRDAAEIEPGSDVARWRDARLANIRDVLDRWMPGTVLKLQNDKQNLQATPISVSHRLRAKDPLALGNFRISLAIGNGDSATIDFPFSQLMELPDRRTLRMPNRPDNAWSLTRSSVTMRELFEMMLTNQRTVREPRFIISGNLFAGFNAISRGQFVRFTTDSGDVQRGILLPRNFTEQDLDVLPANLYTADQIVQFLSRAQNQVLVQAYNKVMDLQRNSAGDWVIRVRIRGGRRYYTSETLRKALFGDPPAGDFKRGTSGGIQVFRAVVSDTSRFRAGLEVLINDLNIRFQTNMEKDLARSITGDPDPTQQTPDRGAPQLRVATSFNEKFTGNRREVTKTIHEIARQLVPGVRVSVVEELWSNIAGRRRKVRGSYIAAENLLTVALNYEDPVSTLRHEAIHALRAMRLITDREWDVLRHRARKWRAQYGIDNRPGYSHEPASVRNEEAIAEAFAEYRAGAKFAPGFRRIFDRIRNFLQRTANALRGLGFQTAEDIFERIERGEVGRRQPKGPRRRQPTRFAVDEEQMSALRDVLSPAEIRSLVSMDAKIGMPERTWKEKLVDLLPDNLTDRLKQGWLDDLHGLKIMEMVANTGKLFEDERSAYKLARLSRGVGDVVFDAMFFGAPVWNEGTTSIDTTVKAPMQILEELGDRAQLFERYLIARRSEELMAQDRERLFTDAEIQAGLALARVHPDFAELAQDLYTYQSRILDFAQASGLIDQETREAFEEANRNYVPYFRIMEGGEVKGARRRRGFSGQHPNFYRLFGGEENVDRPFLNIERNMHRLIEASFKNVVMLRAADLNARTGNMFMTRKGRVVKKGLVTNRQMIKDLEEQGLEISPELVRDDANFKRQLRAVWTVGHAPRGDQQVTLVRDGKVEFYDVEDPMLYRSLTMLHRTPIPLIKPLRMAKHLLTAAVGLDPSFQAANIIRDTMHAAVVSHIGFKPGLDSTRGMISQIKTDPYWREFVQSGAGMSSLFEADRPSMHRAIEQKLRGRKGILGKILDTPRGLVGTLEHIESKMEYATRVGAFKRLREQGKPLIEAAYQAREISTDFALRGDLMIMRFMAETVPFFNAGVQGLYRTARGAHENPTAFFTKGALLASATIALHLLNRDDERYKELPEYQRDLYWHFFIGEDHYKIPKPFEVGALFGSMWERMVDLAIEREGVRFAKRMQFMFGEMFRLDPIPQLFRPPLRVYANWDEFRDRAIIPPWLEVGVRPEVQYDQSTPVTAIEAGKIAGVSPKKLQTLVEGYLGAWGGYLFWASDTMLRATGQYPTKPAIDWWSDPPVLRRFIAPKVPRSTRYINDFYEMKKEVDMLYGTILRLETEGQVQRVLELRREEGRKLGMRDAIKDVDASIKKLNLYMRMIQRNPTMSADQKREQIDRLRAIKNRLARTAMQRLKPAYDRAV